MSLLEAAMEKCVFLEKTRQPDGMGGYLTEYTEGSQFSAAIAFNNSLQAKTAEKRGVSSLYTVTTTKGVGLEYHDVFRRLGDGKVFRVASDSDDMQTPRVASFRYEQVSREEWQPV